MKQLMCLCAASSSSGLCRSPSPGSPLFFSYLPFAAAADKDNEYDQQEGPIGFPKARRESFKFNILPGGHGSTSLAKFLLLLPSEAEDKDENNDQDDEPAAFSRQEIKLDGFGHLLYLLQLAIFFAWLVL